MDDLDKGSTSNEDPDSAYHMPGTELGAPAHRHRSAGAHLTHLLDNESSPDPRRLPESSRPGAGGSSCISKERPSRLPAGTSRSRAAVRRLAAGMLLVVAGLLGVSTAANAQTTLVSNTGQSNDDFETIGFDDYAQAFGTGSHTAGYDFDSIVLSLGSAPTGTGTLTVTVREDASGDPSGTALYTLTTPDPIAGDALNAFTAPAGATLDANTTYWVVASYSSDSDGPNWFRTLLSNGIDSGGATGWTIGSPFQFDSRTTPSGWQAGSTTHGMKLQVNGTAKGTITQTADGATWTLTGDTSVAAGSTYTYTLTLSSGTKPLNEYAGFHLPNTADNQDKLGTDPTDCTSPKQFCISFSGGSTTGTGIWDNVQGHDTRHSLLSDTPPHTLTATFAVASDAPNGSTIEFGAITSSGVPRDDGLTITVDGGPPLSTDATLSALALSGVTLAPTFVSATEDYTATVVNSVMQTTVTATPTHSGATVAFKDGDDTALTNPVTLAVGATVIKAVVTAEDTTTMKTYMVTVTRAGTTDTPVTIEAEHESIGAGLEDLLFTLTREGDTTDALEVTVTIIQAQTWLSDLEYTVTFPANNNIAELTITASNFSFTPSTTGNLTATVTGDDIDGGSDTVAVISTSEAPITISYDMPAYTFAEDATDKAIYLVATLDEAYPREPSRNYFVTFSTTPGTAEDPEDYVTLSGRESFTRSEYGRDADTDPFVARKLLSDFGFAIEDDAIYEGSEGFGLIIEPDLTHVVGMAVFQKPDGTTCEPFGDCLSPPVQYPVTITDEGDLPVLSLSVDPSSIDEEDDDGTTGVTENVSTVTVEITNPPKTFAVDQTVTLTFSGTPTQGTHYSVSPNDADTNAAGHQVVLPAGDSSVEVTVTATGNDTVNGPRTVIVVADRDGTFIGEKNITILDDEDTNTSPTFTDGDDTSRDFNETIGDETVATAANIDTPVEATDTDTGDTLTYSLEGADAARFGIVSTSGQLRTKVGESYSYEARTSYAVTVKVEDGALGSDTIDVTLNVTDQNEPPMKPDPPMVSATTDSTTSLDVSWTAPTNAGRPGITSYDLQYQKDTETDWTDGPEDQPGPSASIGSLEAGTAYWVQVRATNAEGDSVWSNSGPGSTTTTTTTAPAIVADGVQVTSTPMATADTYGLGETIAITVTFDNAVAVDTSGGTPRIQFVLNGTGSPVLKWAEYSRGSGGTALVFTYVVQSGDKDDDGIWLRENELELQGGTISAAADNTVAAILTYARPGTQTEHKVNGSLTTTDATLSALALSGVTLAPTFVSSTETYTATVANAVMQTTVTATPTHSGATVAFKDGDNNTLTNPVPLNVGANLIKAVVTAPDTTTMNTYMVTVTRGATTEPAIVTDGVQVTSTPATGNTYGRGETIAITVTFDEAVTVDTSGGTPRIAFHLDGGLHRWAEYRSGSGGTALVFTYTVQAGDRAADGIRLEGNFLKLQGGTIRAADDDTNTVNAILTYADTGRQSGHKVNGSLTTADATLSDLALSGVTLAPTFVSATETYTATVVNSVMQTMVTASPTQSGATVELKDRNDTVIMNPVDLAVGANVIKAVVTAPDSTTMKTYMVTVTLAPAIVTNGVQVTSTPATGNTYGRGETIKITVTFDNAVMVGGTPRIAFHLDGGLRWAEYSRGSGGTALVFTYTVLADDRAVNGILLAAGKVELFGGTIRAATDTIVDATLTYAEPGLQSGHKVNGSLTTADATLSDLALSGVTLDPTFVSATQDYTATVGNAVKETTVTATPTQSGATVAFKDDDDTALTNPVTLAVGANVIKAVVTAEDTTTMKTYMVTVTRAGTTTDEDDGTTSPPTGTGGGGGGGTTNSPPAITTTSPQSVAENMTAVVTLAATDTDSGDTLTWSKNGGADASAFTLTTAGVLSFASAPNFEDPTDTGTDNGYEVTVRVSDGTAPADLALTVNVTDVAEQPDRPAAPAVSATAGTTTSLDVGWTAPGLNGGPALTGYDLQYREGTSGPFTEGPQAVAGLSTAITDLMAGTAYQVQVRALNGETPSDWSPSGTGSTEPPEPEPVPALPLLGQLLLALGLLGMGRRVLRSRDGGSVRAMQ